MKTLCVAMVILLAIVAIPAAAQVYVDPGTVPQYLEQLINTSKSYADSQIDTTAAFPLGGAAKLSYVIYVADSASMKAYLDYRIVGVSAWTLKDSTTVTKTAAGYSEWVLRDGITDKVPGLAIQIRLRRAFQASDNGVTSATYSDKWCWKP